MNSARADFRLARPQAEPASFGGPSWLCRDESARLRLLDMEERVRPVRQRAFAILAVSIGIGSPWLGWWPLLFLLPATFVFVAADALMARVGRPENVMFGAWLFSGVIIAGALAVAGEAGLPALPWLALPVITLSARFSMRGVIIGVLATLLLVLAVAFGVDGNAVMHDPIVLTAPLTLIICLAVLSTPLMHSDIQHRSDAVIDQLTGMLNRKALSSRVQELSEQSQITGDPVGLIVCDLDHFKRVNDTCGHFVGDVVLKEAAYVLRKQLRAFDLAYRLGGEEFLVLLPGSDRENAGQLAERLRGAVSSEALAGGVRVTMSFGIAASRRGEAFDYSSVFAQADTALYEAKRGGRDQVRGAGAPALGSADTSARPADATLGAPALA